MITIRTGQSIEEAGVTRLPSGAIALECQACGQDWSIAGSLPCFCPTCGHQVPDLPEEFIDQYLEAGNLSTFRFPELLS